MLDVVTSFLQCIVRKRGYDLSVEQYFLLLSFDGDIFFYTMGSMAVCFDELPNRNLAVGLWTR